MQQCCAPHGLLYPSSPALTGVDAPRSAALTRELACIRARAGDSIITVYERAMAQVWLRLEAIAQQHGVSDALQVFVKVRA